MTSLRDSLRFKAIAMASAAAAYPVVLRGAIGMFHPKEGDLLQFISLLGGEESLLWVSWHISYPTYNFLISIWQSAAAFFTLWALVVVMAMGAVSFRIRHDHAK